MEMLGDGAFGLGAIEIRDADVNTRHLPKIVHNAVNIHGRIVVPCYTTRPESVHDLRTYI
jgi:hypothetical protein